jgi:hypothetical protein
MDNFIATFVKLLICRKMEYGPIYNYIIVMKKKKIFIRTVKFVIDFLIIYKFISEIAMALAEEVN